MWENVAEMFPNGYVPYTGIDVPELISNNYESISCTMNKMARNMLVKVTDTIWYADGHVERQILYDLQGSHPDDESCLSVFGNKMVQDWYQREQYRHLQEVKTIQDAGFNYTGLQE